MVCFLWNPKGLLSLNHAHTHTNAFVYVPRFEKLLLLQGTGGFKQREQAEEEIILSKTTLIDQLKQQQSHNTVEKVKTLNSLSLFNKKILFSIKGLATVTKTFEH